MKRLLSGMRPTGRLHLGHLVGALDNWVGLQEKYESFFMVADWHALMSEYADTSDITENIRECVLDWISCGIDPEKSVIFRQSDVFGHLELFMILSCFVPLGWLERCPTYKEQLRQVKSRDLHTLGFLGYPVLQAADILLYKAEIVPIGDDQLPHLELTREILRRFHNIYGSEIFPEPQPLLTKTPRLLGLDNRKMSKSLRNFIALSDSDDQIKKKVQAMFTDPQRIKRSDPGHPETCNLFTYYNLFGSKEAERIKENCINASRGCTECKNELADILIENLAGIRQRRAELAGDKDIAENVLEKGAEKAEEVASETMREVKRAVFKN